MLCHSFNVNHAKQYGVDGAIILYHLIFWLQKNKSSCSEDHFREGRYWSYDTIQGLSTHFQYWTERQIRHTIDKLEKAGVLLTGAFNDEWSNRRKWYSIADPFYTDWILQNCQLSFDKSVNCQLTDLSNVPTDNNTDNITYRGTLFSNETSTPKSQEKKERENVSPKRERKQPDLVLPWDTETFKAIWEKWCDYRWHEHKFRYKSQHSEQAALKQLAEKCKNEAEATQAVYRSMSQGWKGIFPEVANAQTAASNPITNARRKTKYTNTRGEEI